MEGGGDENVVERMDAELVPIYKNIVGIKNALQKIQEQKSIYTMDDLRKYQQMLDAIDRKRGEFGIFGGSLQTKIPSGQAACRDALDQAYDVLADLTATASEMNEEMMHTYSTLCGIGRKLQSMKKQKSHSLEDVKHYQQMVNSIDSKRVDGIFCGSPQTSIPPGQAHCAEVLVQCYVLLDEMKLTAQDLNQDMRAVLMKLTGIRDELREIKHSNRGFVMSSLRHYHVALQDMENSREEGIFCGSLRSGHIPAGQAICSDVLASCHDLLRDLMERSKDFDQDAVEASKDKVPVPQAQC